MLNYIVISKVVDGYELSHVNEWKGKTFVFEGNRYIYFYQDFVDIEQGFYIQEGIDEIEAMNFWYKTVGIHM